MSRFQLLKVLWTLGSLGIAGWHARPSQDPPVVFRHVNVIPMDREEVLRDRTVVIRDGRVEAIGAFGDVEEPANAVIVEGEGRYLLPGLVDMHIHVVNGRGTVGDGAWQQMRLLVANGVTTARSLSGAPTAPEVRDAVRAGELLGPELYLAGPSLNHNSVPTAAAADSAVRAQAGAGFDFLKTHGVSSEAYDAIVRAADELGIRLVGHVTPDFGLDRALEAGQQIEHLDGYLPELAPAATRGALPPGQLLLGPELDALDPSGMPGLARRTAEAGVWNTPTLALFEVVADPLEVEAYEAWPETAYVPGAARAAWKEQVAQLAAMPVQDTRRARFLELRRAMTRALRDAGAPLLAGSDSPQLYMAPGFALHRELAALQAAGLTPYEALASATVNPARYIGPDADFGVVAPGRQADLLLVAENPLDDVAHATEIDGVMVDGRWLDRDAVSHLKDEVARAAGGS